MSKKNRSVLILEARKNKRKKNLKIVWIAALVLICGGIIAGSFYYFGRDRTTYASDTWEAKDLTKMIDPVNHTKGKANEQTLITARATFYDIYSDSQVWSKSEGKYRDAVGSIYDGNDTTTNTFTHFNRQLLLSKKKSGDATKDIVVSTEDGHAGISSKLYYYNMLDKANGVYPLYCGLTWPGQGASARWGDFSSNGATQGNWYAYANCNQYTNKDQMADEGVATAINGGATQGLVNSKLDSDGNITMGSKSIVDGTEIDKTRIVPFFDSNYLSKTYGTGKVSFGKTVSNIAFPFHKGKTGQTVYFESKNGAVVSEAEDTGYYYFDSFHDVIQLKEGAENVEYYYDENQVYDVTTPTHKRGFFPYNTASDSASSTLNYVFGVKMELNFNMTSDGKIKGEDIIFEFNGDDDLWVFVDGYLVLDIGGAHIPVHGKINFAEKKATVDKVKPTWAGKTKEDGNTDDYQDADIPASAANQITSKTYSFGKNSTGEAKELYDLLSDTNKNHTLTIFYMERGKANSNLKIKFNLPQITTLSVGNEIDTDKVNPELKTKGFWESCNSHYFKYKLSNKGTESKDVNNALDITGQAATNWERISLPAKGLSDKLRKKITSTDGVPLRYRFFTFTGTNYFSMVLPKTKVGYVSAGNFATAMTVDDKTYYTKEIAGKTYVFLGWTTDKNYYDHWNEIKDGTYIGNMPETIDASGEFSATESTDFYAVWAKQAVKITYLDQPNVDTPGFGYDSDDIIIKTEEIDTIKTTGEFQLPTDSDTGVAAWENQDTHRKGYRLVGWQMKPTDPKNDEDIKVYTSFDSVPLHNMTLYAKWEKVQTRCVFSVDESVDGIRDTDGNDTAASDGKWKSNIVYFDIGTRVTLPYLDDTKKTEDLSDMFDTLPIREYYGVTEWTTGSGEDEKTYEAGNSGKRWLVPETDTEFVGSWKKVYSDICFDADATMADGTNYNFPGNPKTVRYPVGYTIQNKPELSTIWEDENLSDIKPYKVTGWKKDETEITFPYTVTEADEDWEAKWEKVYSKVIYHFDKNSNINCGTTKTYEQYYSVGSNMETPDLESLRGSAPVDANGTTTESDGSKITHYMSGTDGKAYVISGWSYEEDGSNPVSKDDKIENTDNIELYAIWKEVTTPITFYVFLPGKNNNVDTSEWDTTEAEKKGWKWSWASGGNGNSEWRIRLNCTPGKTYGDYTNRDSGIYKDELYAGDNKAGDTKDIEKWVFQSYTGDVDSADQKIEYSKNGTVVYLYGVWKSKGSTLSTASFKGNNASTETADITSTESENTGNSGSVTKQSAKKKSLVHLFAAFNGSTDGSYENVSETWYQIMDDHMMAGNGTGIGQTDSNGAFYLQYDQIASFLNCFTSTSDMMLKEEMQLYKKKDGNYSTVDAPKSYDTMYNTTWELRDLHDFITDKTKNGSENLEKMPIRKKEDGTYLYDGVYVYDGLVDPTSGTDITKTAFKFQNENQATGTSYATNVRAIFTHEVKTGELTITKSMTNYAKDTMEIKKDSNREFTFYVYFYNIFGGSGDSTIDDKKVLYEGNYVKLDAAGKYVKDADGNVITYTAEDGRIQIKAGETALIKGIPVLTKYQIEEESMKLARRTYVMSGAEEVVTTGLGSENTKYIVKKKADATDDILAAEADKGLEKVVIGSDDVISAGQNTTDVTITGQITGCIAKAGQTYNYIVTNDVSLDGVQITIEKLINEFYYAPDEEYLDGITYQEKTNAKQSFVFHVKCTPVNDVGTVSGNQTEVQQVITFYPDDTEATRETLKTTGRKGWKKITMLYGEPGYYEVTEDTAWSWKYDLRRIELSDAIKMTTPATVFDGTGSDTICRFYVPPSTSTSDTVGTTKNHDGKDYIVVMSNPVINFENTIATDGRSDIKGDTEIAINEIGKPIITPTPKPTAAPKDEYENIIMVGGDITDGVTLRAGQTYTLPNIVGEKKDGSTEVISSVVWSSDNISACTISGNTLTAGTAQDGTIKLTATYKDVITTTTKEISVNGVHNIITIYYNANIAWNPTRIHYAINGAWKTSQAHPEMLPTSEKSGYNWKYILDLGTETNAYVCFTTAYDDSGSWDSNNNSQYEIYYSQAISTGEVGISYPNINYNP